SSRAQRVQDEGVHAEVGAPARELERGPRRHADHRYHEAYRQAIGETELALYGVGAPLLAHTQEAGPEARDEAGEQRLPVRTPEHLGSNDGHHVADHGP